MNASSRDHGLKRISRLTRWVGAAGLASAGLFAVMVAKAQPGRTAVTTPAASGSASSGPPAAGSSGLSQDTSGQVDNGLQAPGQAPVAAGRQPAVVSGGS